MKDHNEMARSVLLRAAEYEAAKKRNRRRAWTAAACLCLAAAVGFGLRRGSVVGGRELARVDNDGTLDGDPNGYSAGQALDRDYNDPLHELRTTVGEPDPESVVKAPANAAEYPTAKPPYVGYVTQSREDNAATGGGAGAVGTAASDTPAQEPYLEAPTGREGLADESFYGGVYMDEQGVVHVLLTEDTPENRAAARSIVPLPDVPDAVVFDTAAYSRGYLDDLQEQIARGMIEKSLPFVTASALDERGNCIRVTVTTDDEAELAKLRARDTRGGALVIERADGAAGYDTLERELAPEDGGYQNLPAAGRPGDAEHIPAGETAGSAQSVSP